MKANELMIGDWVRNDLGEYQTVVELRESGAMLAYNDIYPYDAIEPIPITPEILEKNGFRKDKKCPFVYETDDEDVIIDLYDPAPNARLSKKEDYDKMVGVRLSPAPPYGFSYWGQSLMIRANYVHELQHALRLCGIEKELIV